MSKGRLTRQELGWLLTQEAQGAAERLRVGVQVLKTNAPPVPEVPEAGLGLDATLDALDDAMKMLSSLHKTPSPKGGRRGRIDLAALLWEVAPEARVSIEPGGGTEVFGDEAELRRMIHVLVGHGSGAGSQVNVRREGDEVRVSVDLGPDSSATAETERAWVSRMAIRYGGRYDLEGGAEVITFPADGVSERNEREALRKELDEARKQGEVYARELAQAFAHEETSTSPSTMPPPSLAQAPGSERFVTLGRFAAGVAAELRGILSPAARQVPARAPGSGPGSSPGGASTTDPNEERWDTVRRALARAQDFVAVLASLGELDPNEVGADVELGDVARAAASSLAARAERSGVTVQIDAEAPVVVRAGQRAAAAIAREVLTQAIAASPRGSRVIVRATRDGGPPRLEIDDAGPLLPTSARRAFVALEIDPGTYGRSTSVPLYIASQIASWQGASMELSDPSGGGLRVAVAFPH